MYNYDQFTMYKIMSISVKQLDKTNIIKNICYIKYNIYMS